MGHFYPRQAVLAPAGLITEPNEYGQYPPGALKLARNVTMREPGKLLQAPNALEIASPGPADGLIRKLIPADTSVVYAIVENPEGWQIFADGVAQTFVQSDGTVDTQDVDAFSSTGRISWAQCNERIIVNGRYGCLVRDPVPISTEFRATGLPQPLILRVVEDGNGGWFKPGHMVAYRACLVRRYSEDYTLRSVPSPAIKLFLAPPASPESNVDVYLKWPASSGLEAGDIIEIYRTDILETDSATADPGGTFKLVKQYVLTAADVATPPTGFGFAVKDTQGPVLDTLRTPGRELYTNPGVEGEQYGNLRPPITQCLASFKGFCFFGYTTERAQLVLNIPAGLGILAGSGAPPAARAMGIGRRSGPGTVTVGSATVTGISAANMAGIVPGQLWSADAPFLSGFPAGSRVVSVGVGTFTMDNVATGPNTSWGLDDVIEINGTEYRFSSINELLVALECVFEAQTTETIGNFFTYQPSNQLTLMYNFHSFDRSLEVRATNGQNYSPPIAELDTDPAREDPIVRKNRLCWSKEQQPEHVPSVSETFVGFGEIYALNATRDALWVWCSDGLYRLSGNGGSLGLGAWQVDYANPTLLLCAPQASTVLDDRVYGHTNDGVVEVDSASNLKRLTAGILANIVPGIRYREAMEPILERNEEDGEILLALGELENGLSNRIYIYNVREEGWTYLDENDDELRNVSAIAMFRLPPDLAEPHVLFASIPFEAGLQPLYSRWTGGDPGSDVYLQSTVQYQPLYGDDPLELKRWMWGDFLFGLNSASFITVLWNDLGYSSVPTQVLDVGLYARAGVPRDGGLSHSICPGFEWDASDMQSRFEGISLAIKQRTNQSKQR